MFLSFIESLILLVALTCSVPLLAPVRRRALHWGLVGNMAGFQRERLFGAIPFSDGFPAH